MNIEKNKLTDLILDLEKRKVKKLFQEISLISKTNKKSLIDELSLTINIGHKEIVFILNYLKGFKIISVEDENIILNKSIDEKQQMVMFSKYYFNIIINHELLNKKLFLDSELELIDDFFKIKTSSIELKYRRILITLGKLGLLEYEENYVKIVNYTIAKKFVERTLNKLKKSQKEFEREQFEKKIRGELAEEFVLKHEQEKLENYLFKPIRLSIQDVALGYDILSFDVEGNEIFIEVKSLNNNRFFWTENEIKTSQEIGKDYFLYLISFKNNKPSQIQKIIKNPYKEIFIQNKYKKKNIEDYVVFI